MRTLAKRHGKQEITGARYQDLIGKIISHNTAAITRSIAETDYRALGRAAARMKPEGKPVILPAIEKVLDPEAIQIRKGAESGKLISDTLRSRLSNDLRVALLERKASGRPLYSSGGHGALHQDTIKEFEQRIIATFAPYIKRGIYKTPIQVHQIAVTEVGTAINQIKHEYTKKIIEENGGRLRAMKAWRHYPALSKAPRIGHKKMNRVEVTLNMVFHVPEYKKIDGRWHPTGRKIAMLYPHDPSAPAREVIGCHCGVEYTFIPR